MELTELNLKNNLKKISHYLFFVNYTFKQDENHSHSTGHVILECKNNVFETADLSEFCTTIRDIYPLKDTAVVIINNFILLKTIEIT